MAPGFSLGKARNKTPSVPRKAGMTQRCGPSWLRILPEDRLDGFMRPEP